MKSWEPEDIKKLRQDMSLSQPAFGKLVGVSGNYVYLLEKGVRNASTTLKILLDFVEEKQERKESEQKRVKSKRHLQKK